MTTTVTVPFDVGGSMLKAVQVALFHERHPTDYVMMKDSDDYYSLLKSLWAKGEQFVINEHDIIPWPGAIHELEECSEPWCTFPYRSAAGWLRNGLGLVKFDPARLPNIFVEPFKITHWRNLDMQVARRIEKHVISAHVHSPAVTNLNPELFFVTTKRQP